MYWRHEKDEWLTIKLIENGKILLPLDYCDCDDRDRNCYEILNENWRRICYIVSCFWSYAFLCYRSSLHDIPA